MSADNPASMTEWWQNLPIPWLVSGPNGQAEATANGTLVDQQIALIKQATKAHMPNQAPADALPYIGGDRQLIQGQNESNSNFRTRLQTAWDDWARAGTPLELLVQLYWGGFPGAVIVQQNGLAYNLSGAPTAGSDPTSLLTRTVLSPNLNITHNPDVPILVTITTGGALGTMQFKLTVFGIQTGAISTTATTDFSYQASSAGAFTTNTWLTFGAGTYVLNSTYTLNTDGTITLGGSAINTVTQNSAPWWTFDTSDYFCSRFAVLFAGPIYPQSFILGVSGRATFSNSQTSTLTWSNALASTSYLPIVGRAIVTDGGPAPTISVDGTATTTTAITVNASAPFTGEVDAVAFGGIGLADLSVLRTIIKRWRPAKATCLGITCVMQGQLWGWPVTTWGAAGLTWGPAMVMNYSA